MNSILLYCIIAASITIITILGSALIFFKVKDKDGDYSYDEQLNSLIAFDDEDAEDTQINFTTKWNRYWSQLSQDSGWGRYSTESPNTAGRDALLAILALIFILSIMMRSPLIGIALSAGITYGATALLKMRAAKKSDGINAQLPGFLFALKANIQGNETPERAILKVVDNMPSPLYEDLVIVKQRLLANSTFAEALTELSERTSSRDLKFLCACMIQASTSGANLEKQITKIQEVLDNRRRVSDEIDKAVRSATPAIWVASIVLPGVFLFTLIADPNAKDFWFVNPLSWLILTIVVLLYIVGVWGVRKLVNNIRSL